MRPPNCFAHCPRCGTARPPEAVGQVPVQCVTCGLTLFLNPAVAAAGFLFDGPNFATAHVLLTRREHEPARGKWAMPGGFLDPDETAEAGLQRETREEVGLEVAGIRYVTSCPNLYHYRGIDYPVLDLVFAAIARNPTAAARLDAVAELAWQPLADIDPADLAFPSLRAGLAKLRQNPLQFQEPA